MDAFKYGLTPIFEEVPPGDLIGCIREQPGIYLVGLRSILSGRLLLYQYLIRVAGIYGLAPPILLSDRVHLPSFLSTSHCEGVITLSVDRHNNQYISREKTKFYNETSEFVKYLRYGQDFPGFLRALRSVESVEILDFHLKPNELILVKYIREMLTQNLPEEVIRKRARAKRRQHIVKPKNER